MFWIRYRTVCILPEELKIKTVFHAEVEVVFLFYLFTSVLEQSLWIQIFPVVYRSVK